MKILVVSLLRLGDVLLALPTIKGLRRRYPDAKIDVLMNSNASVAGDILADVDSFHLFPRMELQKSLGDINRPIFEALDEVVGFTQKLSDANYDIVVNTTQTKLSGYICGMIDAKEKFGLCLSHSDRPHYGSAWYKFLNDVVASGGSTVFHFSDIFYLGSGLQKGKQLPDKQPRLLSVKNSEINIVLQPLTSDEKKNYGSQRWVETLCHLQTISARSLKVTVLGAPDETRAVESIVADLLKVGVQAVSIICDLKEATRILQNGDLLLTGDTSIKHLASNTDIKIVEIALGSSIPAQTGAYKADSLIITPQTKCRPCSHSASCHQPRHLCSEDLTPVLVSSAIHNFFESNWSELHKLGDELDGTVSLFRTAHLPNGFWFAEKLGSKFILENINSSGELCAWRAILDKEHLQSLGGTGSEGLLLCQFWLKRLGPSGKNKLQIAADQLETETMRQEDKLNSLLNKIAKQIRTSSGLKNIDFLDQKTRQEINIIEHSLGLGQAVTNTLTDGQNTFWAVRAMQIRLNEIFSQQGEKKRVLRSLRSELHERMF